MWTDLKRWIARFFVESIKRMDVDSRKKLREGVNRQLNRPAVEERIRGHLNDLSRGKAHIQEFEILKVSKAFYGFFDRLIARYTEIIPVEWEIHREPRKPSDRTIAELQDEFVNKTEGFHQQIYAAISAFIKLLSHVAPRSFLGQMPSASVTNFLNFLDTQIEGISAQIDILKKSTGDYRTNYIDHTNQSTSHDWFTSSGFDGKCRIVYYTNRGSGTLLPIPELSFPGLAMHTPFPAEAYCVPPHHTDTIGAFISVVLATLAHVGRQENNSPQKS